MPTTDFEGFKQGGSTIPVKDTTARNSITAILDGTTIDSFGDVEAALSGKVDTSSLGQNSGVATLDANGKVPSSQIPAGVGTAVEGNPTEAATAGDLTKIKIDSDVYSIPSGGGGGTTVVANPTGTATADLNKVQIGTDIYDIPDTTYQSKQASSGGTDVSLVTTGEKYTWNEKVSKSQTAGLLKNDGTVNTTIEGAVTANTSAISAIKDGTNIDSFGDVESALEDKVGWEKYAETGAVNLLNNIATSGSDKGITYTVNADKSVSIGAGTVSDGNLTITLTTNAEIPANKRVFLSGCPQGGSSDSYMLAYQNASDQWKSAQYDIGNGMWVTDGIKRVAISILNGVTVSAMTFKPMISFSDNTPYAPYAKTNRELTEDVANIPTVSVTHTGTASSTGVRKQQITVNNVSYDVDGSAYMEQSVTLSTSQSTDVVFTNAIIADGTELTFSSSIWDLVPDDMVTATGVCTVTLPKWTSAVTIGCRLRVR